MANIIKPKRSTVANKVPTTSDIVNGEIAINSTDQKIYTNAGGTVTQVGAGKLTALADVSVSGVTTGQSLAWNGSAWVNSSAGAGDVTGAASSTDNALVRFDGTTGKVIQNGNITQDDNGNLANVNAVGFDTTPGTLPTAAGSMYWDTGNGSPSVILDTDVTLQVGQEMLALVYNGTGSTITNGSVVAVTGAQGQRPSVSLADADSESLSAPTLGIATEDIANGAEGFVTTFGFVRGLNTSGFTAGAPIYLSQTAGQFTATRPSAPAHTVALGWVIKVNASSGEVFVNINNGWELDELHNVLITSPTSGNTLVYDAVVGVWKNASITAGTGISVTNGAGSITIANTGVTSVGATAPIQSSGGATPTISITQAGAASNGYLSSTDWNTFNNKTSNTGTVTSVAMTVPTGLTISGSPITTSGTLALTFTAGYSIPTTASQTNWDTAYSDRLKWDGGSTGLVAATGRTSLGGTTVGQNFFTLTNPSAITFPRMNADNTVSALDAATFRTAIGAGTGSGTVTSVTGTSPVVSSGGTTPAISLASGYGDTQNPYASKTANYVLAAPNGVAGVPTFRAIVAADIPTLNQNTTGTAGGLTGTPNISVGTVSASGVITSTVVTGTAPLTIASTTLNTNLNADLLDGNHASAFYLASNPNGYTSNTGTVTSVGMTVPTGLSISGTPITTSGTLALTFTAGYSIPTTASQTNWDSAYTQRLQWDGGSTNLVAATGRTSLGATTLGSNLFTITNPSAVTFPRFNADNTVSALDAATFRSAIGAGTGSGTVTSVGITAGTGISVSGSPVTSSGSITVNNTGVTSVTAGTGISVSASTGGVTISSTQTAQNLNYDLFVATASQTTFSTSATYTSGKIQVYRNGALMRNGTDVTVTSGSNVVFAVALTSGDYVDIIYPPASSSGTMKYDQFTATASQTTFVTSQSYTSGKIQVFVNGALQRNNGDVTVTSGTQIVFATGLAAGSLVDVCYPI